MCLPAFPIYGGDSHPAYHVYGILALVYADSAAAFEQRIYYTLIAMWHLNHILLVCADTTAAFEQCIYYTLIAMWHLNHILTVYTDSAAAFEQRISSMR